VALGFLSLGGSDIPSNTLPSRHLPTEYTRRSRNPSTPSLPGNEYSLSRIPKCRDLRHLGLDLWDYFCNGVTQRLLCEEASSMAIYEPPLLRYK
jgi:hypothetical protein